ncbi:MFS transporter, partial [Streptomyces albus]|uniref:MFS transporter n=1 Tax=Streptomyces albus TaxID=1888 RepID=UPI0006E18201
MEWFDFGVYSYLAATIGKVFYPGASDAAQLLASFATFAAAFVVRPLGGLFFGPLGDKLGRQKVLAATMILMAFGTFLIGFIPSYATIGIAAPILLLVARMLQGFSTGGEYGGATTFIAEFSPDRRRGFLGSWLDFGTFVGYALGSLLVTVLNLALTDDQMLSWGWRIPFLIAGPLGLIGLYMRLKLEESPAFQQQLDEHDQKLAERETNRHEFRTILRRHWQPLLICIGLVLLYNVTNYMVTGYLPTYQTEVLGRGGTTSDILVLVGMVWVVVLITFIGRLSDRVGRRPVYRWAAGFAAPSAATLPALFPTSVRYAAMGIGFNFSVAAFGGTTPLITEGLVSATGNDLVPGAYLIVSGLIGLLAVRFMPESAGVPLHGSQPMVSTEQEAKDLISTSQQLQTLSRK